jgi:hypothetical protein
VPAPDHLAILFITEQTRQAISRQPIIPCLQAKM